GLAPPHGHGWAWHQPLAAAGDPPPGALPARADHAGAPPATGGRLFRPSRSGSTRGGGGSGAAQWTRLAGRFGRDAAGGPRRAGAGAPLAVRTVVCGWIGSTPRR